MCRTGGECRHVWNATGHRPATRKKIRTSGEISGEERPTITSSSASTSFLPDDASSQVRRVSDKKLRGWDTLTCVYKVGWVRKKREWEKRNKREREGDDMISCALWHFTCSTDRHSSSSPHLSSYFRSCWPRYLSLYLEKKSCVRFVCNMCRLDPLPWVYSTSRIYTHTCVQKKKNMSTLVWGWWVGGRISSASYGSPNKKEGGELRTSANYGPVKGSQSSSLLQRMEQHRRCFVSSLPFFKFVKSCCCCCCGLFFLGYYPTTLLLLLPAFLHVCSPFVHPLSLSERLLLLPPNSS